MGIDTQLWTVLGDEEKRPLWGGSGWGLPPSSYVFPSPADGYTFSDGWFYEDNEGFESLVADLFVACLGDDPYLYALE